VKFFQCDYAQGTHPNVLQRLNEIQEQGFPGYGEDDICRKAADKIRSLCQAPEAAVHFLVGGTQTNQIVIAAVLRPHQGVVCAETGHINVHETGAIEAVGHKVLALPAQDGKITAAQIRDYWNGHWNDANHEHLVQPGMVYISQPTESGTLYSKAELTAISNVCRETGMPLYVDGARLGYGLTAESNDVTLADLAALCDAFYMGGTKQGALFGEALVLLNSAIARDFRYGIKQHGGMLAKGWLLGLQFDALLEDELYFRLAKHANTQAYRIRDVLRERGLSWGDSPTNQQFARIPVNVLRKLEKTYMFSPWEPVRDGMQVIRICTSWATKTEDVDALIADLRSI